MTFEELKALSPYDQKAEFEKISKIRTEYKAVSYGALYGIGPETLAIQIGKSKKEATAMLKNYWKRNWAVKKVADNQYIREIYEDNSRIKGKWLYNPVSKMFYPLRKKADTFSTLNQGTGAYVFDLWLKKIINKREQLTAQFHDSLVLQVKQGHRKGVEALIKGALEELNKEGLLNVKLYCDLKYGKNYGFKG